jgi:hypothetical protein
MRAQAFGAFTASIAPFAEMGAAAFNHHDLIFGISTGFANLFGQIAHHTACQRIAFFGATEINADNARRARHGKCETSHAILT